MKGLLITIFTLVSVAVSAQNDWVKPTEPAAKSQAMKSESDAAMLKKKVVDPKYLAGGAPLVDGKVQWTLELDVPGKSAEQIYDAVYQYMTELTGSSNQLKGSQVALINPKEHVIIVSVKEWLIFKNTAISLDRTVASYKILATCKDNHLQLNLSRIVFDYTENMPAHSGVFTAEEWISDESALNKKQTKIYPGSAKFRKKMIDRKDEIFNQVSELWK